jgi:hypothetical protein
LTGTAFGGLSHLREFADRSAERDAVKKFILGDPSSSCQTMRDDLKSNVRPPWSNFLIEPWIEIYLESPIGDRVDQQVVKK